MHHELADLLAASLPRLYALAAVRPSLLVLAAGLAVLASHLLS